MSQSIELDDETRRLLETALVLTAAAGGKIVVTKQTAANLGSGQLLITEDNVTGDKVYEIVRKGKPAWATL